MSRAAAATNPFEAGPGAAAAGEIGADQGEKREFYGEDEGADHGLTSDRGFHAPASRNPRARA
jgi:hypothetical protein